MGHRKEKRHRDTAAKSHTLPSSPDHSSSSSDFEFTISISPRKSSFALCPADELFYKGQLLPLQLSPRLSMVRTLLLSSASTSSSSDTTTTASRDSTASTDSSATTAGDLDCDSKFKHLMVTTECHRRKPPPSSSKYFSLPKLSSVFRRDTKNAPPVTSGGAKRVSSSAKDVLFKYLKKVKPLYEKFSQNSSSRVSKSANAIKNQKNRDSNLPPEITVPNSFSGNLSYPRVKTYISSCPSSMGSSPRHGRNGVVPGFGLGQMGRAAYNSSDSSSMDELQSAIQGAIAVTTQWGNRRPRSNRRTKHNEKNEGHKKNEKNEGLDEKQGMRS